LDAILSEAKLEEVLGENVVFDLRCLLIEKLGSNYRNDFAHGLLSDDGFSSYTAIYLWWLVLHLCYLGKKISPPQE
ncbi:MAG TPA: DUF4209 domain-containing protein, partial [Aggregatilineales bacterium]|nr:DUF4209 domain-containing protein [Aggregatilineales bacterium]